LLASGRTARANQGLIGSKSSVLNNAAGNWRLAAG